MWKVSGYLPCEICHAVIQKWQAARVQPLEVCQFEISPVKLTSSGDPKMASRSCPASSCLSVRNFPSETVIQKWEVVHLQTLEAAEGREILGNRRMWACFQQVSADLKILSLGLPSVGYHQWFYRNIGVRYRMFRFNVLGSVLLYLVSKKFHFISCIYTKKLATSLKVSVVLIF